MCLFLGYLTGFGIIIVGNYRMTELFYGHLIGAILAFMPAANLCLIVVLTYLELPRSNISEFIFENLL